MRFLLICVLMMFSLETFASSIEVKNNVTVEKKFNLRLTVGNNMDISQEASTDVALSLINGLAYLSDKNDWSNWRNTNNRFLNAITSCGAMVATMFNHEISAF